MATKRKWIHRGDEFDKECILKWEYILGRKLRDWDEYVMLEDQLYGMILEYQGRKDFFADFPKMKRYKSEYCKGAKNT